jgi:hypothetical protein
MSGKSNLAAVQADAENPGVDSPVEVALCGETVHVLPLRKWKGSAMRALREGDFDSWAERCLVDGDYDEVWAVVDPDLDQIDEFFAAWQEATGETIAKLRASSRPSRSTARR